MSTKGKRQEKSAWLKVDFVFYFLPKAKRIYAIVHLEKYIMVY